jgi:polyisoprenoid-binding protein YceI
MSAFYRDGERFALDTDRSVVRFALHNLGLPTLKGTLRPRSGEIIVGPEDIVRAADFHMDADSIDVHGGAGGEIIRWLFGDDSNPVVTFTTTWARPIGHEAVELEGTLKMHGAEHLLSLRSRTGLWEAHHLTGAMFHKSAVIGVIDRKTWDSRHEIRRDIASFLLGHDVHLSADFYAGPKIGAKTNNPAG